MRKRRSAKSHNYSAVSSQSPTPSLPVDENPKYKPCNGRRCNVRNFVALICVCEFFMLAVEIASAVITPPEVERISTSQTGPQQYLLYSNIRSCIVIIRAICLATNGFAALSLLLGVIVELPFLLFPYVVIQVVCLCLFVLAGVGFVMAVSWKFLLCATFLIPLAMMKLFFILQVQCCGEYFTEKRVQRNARNDQALEMAKR